MSKYLAAFILQINRTKKENVSKLSRWSLIILKIINISFFYFILIKKRMSFAQATTSNRINPLTVSTVEQTAAPYVTYDEVALCTDPNCPVCRAQRRDKRHKHHKRHHHHHHRKHKKTFWDSFLRTESPSAVSVHSIELDDRRAHITERAVVPINQTEREVVTTTTNKPRYYRDDDEVLRDAWVNKNSIKS